ncbi:YbbR-like domain-containing protein [Bryobacter aggregatus]|uniref:CdaR family protein n=1 Tax=Bryobacter aggregatus TaxID=360054 RepID=UPI0004E1F1DA|nr:CdaR family protein [Bryobacter aggregatus]
MRFLTENFLAKVMSVFIAFLLWVALVDEPELIETVTVPVEYRNLSRSLDLSPDVPDRIQLQVKGPRGRLSEVSAEKTSIVLDLADMQTPSARTFTIQDSAINLPTNVNLLRSMPSQLRVKLERRLYKEVPVSVTFEQPMPQHLRVISSAVSPSMIKVVGPESRISLITTLPTEPIDLAQVDVKKPIRLNVLLGDPELSIVGSAQVVVQLETVTQP